MYVDAKTAVRIGTGTTGGFEIRVGVHQGSCLSPLLFIIVMDAVSEHIDREVPWGMLYADDLALAEQTETGMQNRFGDWQRTLECKGLKVNINKTETMVCSKVPETVTIKDAAGNTLKQTETFKYLRSTFSAQGGCEHDVRNRIKIAWQKWRELTRVLCDNKMPIQNSNQGKSLQINDQASDDVRCGSLDTDEKRGRTIGKGRDENATMDTRSVIAG